MKQISVDTEIHTVGPANKEVPESAMAEQPLAQNPEIEMLALRVGHRHRITNKRPWTEFSCLLKLKQR